MSETGTLPSGVTLTDNGDGTATLGGTPGVDSGGSYPITVTATNGVGTPATQSFTLTVSSAPSITSADATTFTVGSAGSFSVTATGNPAPTIAESGALPSGVSFSGGVLSGTPGPSSVGNYPITFTATNGIGSPASQSFTFSVGEAPTITSAASTAFAVGSPGSFTVTATGYPTPSITEWGNLPTGVTFAGGVLSGTPDQSGTFPVLLTASNGVSPNATQIFTLTVNGLTVTTTSLPTLTEGVPYDYPLGAIGGVPPLKWAKLVKLPKGLKLSKGGVLSGVVPASKVAPGDYTVEVKVTDSSKKPHQTVSATYTLVIVP